MLMAVNYQVCNRCVKAKRTCGGYKDESDIIFRHHRHDLYRDHSDTREAHEIESEHSRRKNPLSKVAHYTSADWHDAALEREARELFLNDYSVISSDRSLSRGYLDGLRQLLVYTGSSSEVSRAVTIVSLASYGNKHHRPEICAEAKFLYFQLLQSFQKTISNVATFNIVESLVTAVLLGLYEVGNDGKYLLTARSSPWLDHFHHRGIFKCSQRSL